MFFYRTQEEKQLIFAHLHVLDFRIATFWVKAVSQAKLCNSCGSSHGDRDLRPTPPYLHLLFGLTNLFTHSLKLRRFCKSQLNVIFIDINLFLDAFQWYVMCDSFARKIYRVQEHEVWIHARRFFKASASSFLILIQNTFGFLFWELEAVNGFSTFLCFSFKTC